LFVFCEGQAETVCLSQNPNRKEVSIMEKEQALEERSRRLSLLDQAIREERLVINWDKIPGKDKLEKIRNARVFSPLSLRLLVDSYDKWESRGRGKIRF